jgi:hypothetical protein
VNRALAFGRRIDSSFQAVGASPEPASGRFRQISLKNPLVWRLRCAPAAPVSEAKLGLAASCAENRRRKRDALRQFPQIWAAAANRNSSLAPLGAQSTEPEDALQMSDEHLDLFLSRHETA